MPEQSSEPSGDVFGSLAGRVILYTGGAGGLGLPTTLAFLRMGARVVVVDNDPAKTSALRAAAGQAGLDAALTVAELDLGEQDALRAGLEDLSADAGGFDIAINNAAIYPSKPFEDFTLAEIQRVQRINVESAIICVQVALPHMKAQGWGRIINISSITFSGGWEDLGPYIQSKGALIALARVWAREFGKYGITANAISPGAFPTDAEKIHPDLVAYEKRILDSQAVKRRGRPDDIANALMFLASGSSSFITGQTLNVDGGWVMN